MNNNKQKFISGNEAAVLGAIAAGAEVMFGYPITPATEILENWIKVSSHNNSLKYLQTEDETSAGFGVIGSILGGIKAFTASAGPGHILLQDPISMAENLRLPFVTIIMQRGGPSTGTVNFSQQEVNLACFGGNGDGLRIVYSASSVYEMYSLTIKSFSSAWKYRFPTFVLGDGYLGKMKEKINLNIPIRPVKSNPILRENNKPTYLRNCYSSEESFGEVIKKNVTDWMINRQKIAESELYRLGDADELIIAHGIVSGAAKEAIDILRKENKKIGLFRPITLNPLDNYNLRKILRQSKKAYLFESSLNQLSHIIKYESYGLSTPIIEFPKPAEGYTADDIVKNITRIM